MFTTALDVGRNVAHNRLAVVNQLAHVEDNVAALGLVVDHGAQVRAGKELHRAIVPFDIVEHFSNNQEALLPEACDLAWVRAS